MRRLLLLGLLLALGCWVLAGCGSTTEPVRQNPTKPGRLPPRSAPN